jgi:A/G-specific adenine glycosylase
MKKFIKTIWTYYRTHGREMPWREDTRPYYVVVSEIMLQQTQVHRVLPKFESFVRRFPTWKSLALASTKEVLQEWSGLGYNRRALFLKRIAETITRNGKTAGTLPNTLEDLRALPGIGPNTAGSILAFAYNLPHPFIETNIRSVFIHFFFPEIEKREGKKACKKISDDQLMPFIEEALHDPNIKKNPREWYYALMDYGAMLKRTEINPSRKSSHHLRQSEFKGSNRELRSHILKEIIKNPLSEKDIFEKFSRKNPQQIVKNIGDLTKEGFIVKKGAMYRVVI